MITQPRFQSAVASSCTALLLFLLFPFTTAAQNIGNGDPRVGPSGLVVYSSTAMFRPGTSLLARIDSPFLRDKPGSGESVWLLQLGILEMLEFEISNEGTIAKANGDMQLSPMWGMKFRILQSDGEKTVLSALVRSSMGTGKAETWTGTISSFPEGISDKGLEQYRYDDRFISAGFLFSHAFDQDISFHSGLETGQISVYNAELDFAAYTPGGSQGTVPRFIRTFDLRAFVGLGVRPTQQWDLEGELQTLPELAPSHDETTIETYRAYRAAIELKYAATKFTLVTVKASHMFLPVGDGVSEVRLGVEASASLQ